MQSSQSSGHSFRYTCTDFAFLFCYGLSKNVITVDAFGFPIGAQTQVTQKHIMIYFENVLSQWTHKHAHHTHQFFSQHTCALTHTRMLQVNDIQKVILLASITL